MENAWNKVGRLQKLKKLIQGWYLTLIKLHWKILNNLSLNQMTKTHLLSCYFIAFFKSMSLKELSLKFEAGTNMRFFSLRTLYENLGEDMCAVILKGHILTGSDVTNSNGTKWASLKASPYQHLQHFWLNIYLNGGEVRKSERYLVRVLNPTSNCNFSNDLWFKWYADRKVPLTDLPATACFTFWTYHAIPSSCFSVDSPFKWNLWDWYL